MLAGGVVLVHGGFVDGSGWEAVYRLLRREGHRVSVVQNPTISLSDDVRVTKHVIAAQTSPVVLVGHSYGGVVITEADPGASKRLAARSASQLARALVGTKRLHEYLRGVRV